MLFHSSQPEERPSANASDRFLGLIYYFHGFGMQAVYSKHPGCFAKDLDVIRISMELSESMCVSLEYSLDEPRRL